MTLYEDAYLIAPDGITYEGSTDGTASAVAPTAVTNVTAYPTVGDDDQIQIVVNWEIPDDAVNIKKTRGVHY